MIICNNLTRLRGNAIPTGAQGQGQIVFYLRVFWCSKKKEFATNFGLVLVQIVPLLFVPGSSYPADRDVRT